MGHGFDGYYGSARIPNRNDPCESVSSVPSMVYSAMVRKQEDSYQFRMISQILRFTFYALAAECVKRKT